MGRPRVVTQRCIDCGKPLGTRLPKVYLACFRCLQAEEDAMGPESWGDGDPNRGQVPWSERWEDPHPCGFERT